MTTAMTHRAALCIGCVPIDEPVARTGANPDWLWLQVLEAETYRAALIARFDLPPDRFELVVRSHDAAAAVGTGIEARFDANDSACLAYFETVNAGLETWSEANFTAPVHYHPSGAERPGTRRTTWDCVLEAIITSSQLVGSIEGGDVARTIVDNLTRIYPSVAAEAMAQLTDRGLT